MNERTVRFEVRGESANCAVQRQPGPPESWNEVLPGKTLAPAGSHAMMCHACGRRRHPREGSAARRLTELFIKTYAQSDAETPARLIEAARSAYASLAAEHDGQPEWEAAPGLVAVSITSRGLDWLQAGEGRLFVYRPQSGIERLGPPENGAGEEPARTPLADPDGAGQAPKIPAAAYGTAPVDDQSIVITAGAGIDAVPRAELEGALLEMGMTPPEYADRIRRAFWNHDEELKAGTPAVTVGTLTRP